MTRASTPTFIPGRAAAAASSDTDVGPWPAITTPGTIAGPPARTRGGTSRAGPMASWAAASGSVATTIRASSPIRGVRHESRAGAGPLTASDVGAGAGGGRERDDSSLVDDVVPGGVIAVARTPTTGDVVRGWTGGEGTAPRGRDVSRVALTSCARADEVRDATVPRATLTAAPEGADGVARPSLSVRVAGSAPPRRDVSDPRATSRASDAPSDRAPLVDETVVGSGGVRTGVPGTVRGSGGVRTGVPGTVRGSGDADGDVVRRVRRVVTAPDAREGVVGLAALAGPVCAARVS